MGEYEAAIAVLTERQNKTEQVIHEMKDMMAGMEERLTTKIDTNKGEYIHMQFQIIKWLLWLMGIIVVTLLGIEKIPPLLGI